MLETLARRCPVDEGPQPERFLAGHTRVECCFGLVADAESADLVEN